MKLHKRRVFSLILLFVLMVTLTACNQKAMDSEQPTPDSQGTVLEDKEFRVASLLGPTGMGMVKLLADKDQGTAELNYEFSLVASPDELVAKIINGEVDVAALPTNLALLLYNKTAGQIQLAAVNTLGVLYLLEQGEEINTIADLKGKEIYLSGKGSTPDYIMQYLLQQHGLVVGQDVHLTYFTQHSDLAAALVAKDADVGVLPQPHVTTALMNSPDLRLALDITAEWEQATDQRALLPMGCIVVQKEFAENHSSAMRTFLAEYQESVTFVNQNRDQAAELLAQYKIVPSVMIAKEALPYCNIVYMDAQTARPHLDQYYQILYDFEPSAVGGTLADDGFYYFQE